MYVSCLRVCGLAVFSLIVLVPNHNLSFYFTRNLLFERMFNCTARQCSPLRRQFMGCFIINPAVSLLIKHLVIGQRQKAPNFSAFHWSLTR